MSPDVNLDQLVLERGAHDSPDEGGCMLEWVSYAADEPWSDHPQCVSPVIGAFCRRWNDRMNDADRQLLKPYIPLVIGTNTGRDDDVTRAWMCVDWLIHECAPAWLRVAGMTDHAEALEGLIAVTSRTDWLDVRETVYAARDAARALRQERVRAAVAGAVAGAEAVAGAVAEAGAGAEAVAVAVAVAEAVAEAGAGAVAEAGAEAVAEAGAGAVAEAEAEAVAGAEAEAGAGVWRQAVDAAQVAYDKDGYYAAVDAARAVLQPFMEEHFGETIQQVRTSAFCLLDRMIEVGKTEAVEA